MTPLSPTDQLFFWLEKRQQPMHVGGLQLFSFPEGAPDNYVAQLADQLRNHTRATPPFDRRLDSKLAQPVWVRDEHLDLEHHFRFEALPTPGRIRELLTFVSAEHSHLLDRARPLWEFHLIEGLGNRQFALYIKVHHSLMDGMSAMKMAQRMLSTDAGQRNMPPVWNLPERTDPRDSTSALSLWQSMAYLLGASGKQLGTVPTVVRELLRTINAARKNPDYDSIFHAPRSILNQKITSSRRFAAQSYCLKRIRKVCEAYGTTVNDVVTAMCAHALRSYLISLDALPANPLIAMVPISLRRNDSAMAGNDNGNQVGVILASLHTDESDAGTRLVRIHQGMQEAKARYADRKSVV